MQSSAKTVTAYLKELPAERKAALPCQTKSGWGALRRSAFGLCLKVRSFNSIGFSCHRRDPFWQVGRKGPLSRLPPGGEAQSVINQNYPWKLNALLLRKGFVTMPSSIWKRGKPTRRFIISIWE